MRFFYLTLKAALKRLTESSKCKSSLSIVEKLRDHVDLCLKTPLTSMQIVGVCVLICSCLANSTQNSLWWNNRPTNLKFTQEMKTISDTRIGRLDVLVIFTRFFCWKITYLFPNFLKRICWNGCFPISYI